jgi:molybdopterin-guanine dinucleotide biosynthesis protein A
MLKQDVTGIVLAGGKSSRMGTDKSLLVWQCKTLIEHAIDKLKPLCQKVVVSSNQHQYDFTGCETWPDIVPLQAPIIGIFSCLKRSETEVNLVLSCDMPLISTEFLEFLLESASNHEIVVPLNFNGLIEPLCGVYKKTITPEMEKYISSNKLSLVKFIETLENKLVSVESFSSHLFKNINTPYDYRNI